MITLDYNKKYNKGQVVADRCYVEIVRNHFSEKNENYHYAKKANRFVPERFYTITKTGLFDLGLYDEIKNFLIEKQFTDVTITDELKKNLDIGFDGEVFDDLALKHRDYGLVAVENALRMGRGTILSATGSGKSFITASLVHNIIRKANKPGFRAFVIVPGTSLVKQLCNDFRDYSVPFSYAPWSGKEPLNENVDVVICNREILISRFSSHPWIRDIDLVIVDECHQIKKDNEITGIVSKIRTPHKYGFTGTIPKSKSDEWKIIGLFGPIVFEKSSSELREVNFLSDVVIRIIKLIHAKPLKMDYRRELEYIRDHERRNEVLSKLVNKIDKNCLLMVDSLEYGEILKEVLTFENRETFFVNGEMPVEERMGIVEKMENQDNIICVAMSSIFSTGINIKNLPFIFFLSPTKSFVRIVQSIGRGLRLHPNKKLLTIFDFYDNLKYSEAHSEERKRIYDEQKIEWKEKEIKL